MTTMSDAEMLACPFCEKRSMVQLQPCAGPQGYAAFYIVFDSCTSTGPLAKEPLEAIRLWNGDRNYIPTLSDMERFHCDVVSAAQDWERGLRSRIPKSERDSLEWKLRCALEALNRNLAKITE